ncbi:hypothetical protein Anapl_06697 [Anas platyrhynchos]|uniref:Uncharacterized protein n=1 Tax=Anas platyrhynchos TaxID=8839 RepID=R0KA92_ANAPL|nr:hypothetical protein Anapl_06697 [Anas platyrhynchos]
MSRSVYADTILVSFGVTKVNTKTHSLRPEGCDVTAAITHGSDRYVPGSCVLLSNKTQLDVRCRNSCPSMPRAESPPACVSAIYQELFVCQHCQLLLLFGDLQSRRQTPRASQSNARVSTFISETYLETEKNTGQAAKPVYETDITKDAILLPLTLMDAGSGPKLTSDSSIALIA